MVSALGLILIAALLAVVALLIVLVVVFATNKSFRSSPGGKALGLGLLIGVPLIGLIGLAGLFVVGFATTAVVSRVESRQEATRQELFGEQIGPNEFLERDRAKSREVFDRLHSDNASHSHLPTGPDRTMELVTKPVAIPEGGTVEISRTGTVTDENGAKRETSVVVESPVAGAAEVPVAGPPQPSRPGPAASVEMFRIEDLPPLSDVLRARKTVPEEPAWARQVPVLDEKGTLVALSSQRFATLDEAEQQVTRMAIAYLRTFYSNEHPARGEWDVPVSIIRQDALNEIVGQEIEKDFGKMYLAHLRLNLTDQLRGSLQRAWRGQIVTQRLWMLGGGVGLMTLVLGTAAGYFRLDNLTGGKYRGRLKLAAASLIGAAGLAAGAVVRLV